MLLLLYFSFNLLSCYLLVNIQSLNSIALSLTHYCVRDKGQYRRIICAPHYYQATSQSNDTYKCYTITANDFKLYIYIGNVYNSKVIDSYTIAIRSLAANPDSDHITYMLMLHLYQQSRVNYMGENSLRCTNLWRTSYSCKALHQTRPRQMCPWPLLDLRKTTNIWQNVPRSIILLDGWHTLKMNL